MDRTHEVHNPGLVSCFPVSPCTTKQNGLVFVHAQLTLNQLFHTQTAQFSWISQESRIRSKPAGPAAVSPYSACLIVCQMCMSKSQLQNHEIGNLLGSELLQREYIDATVDYSQICERHQIRSLLLCRPLHVLYFMSFAYLAVTTLGMPKNVSCHFSPSFWHLPNQFISYFSLQVKCKLKQEINTVIGRVFLHICCHFPPAIISSISEYFFLVERFVVFYSKIPERD